MDQRKNVPQEGIPVTDSASNELYYWIRDGIQTFSGRTINYMVKGDNNAKYTVFKGVIDALRRNDQNKYKLITTPEAAPYGTEEYNRRNAGKTGTQG